MYCNSVTDLDLNTESLHFVVVYRAKMMKTVSMSRHTVYHILYVWTLTQFSSSTVYGPNCMCALCLMSIT